MKYKIKKISNQNEVEDIYLKIIKYSPQKNRFCSKEILKFFFEDLDMYTVSKNDQIKSFVYLIKDNDNKVMSEPFIYSGIINHPKLLMNNSRYNNEVFKINDLIVKEILTSYKCINFNLPLEFLDTRPFLWYNYGYHDRKRFQVTPCYTSIINIEAKEKNLIFNGIDDVKRRDIRKVINDDKYQVSNKINLDLIQNFYIETMKKNKGTFNYSAFKKIFKFIETQSKEDKIIQSTTYYLEKPIYSVLFLNDDSSSCYLYGSGDINTKNRYAGSLSLWKAIEQSIEKKLSYIDLEGINSPFRGEYKLNFGGNVQVYFNVNI